jgi:hypothetical protein
MSEPVSSAVKREIAALCDKIWETLAADRAASYEDFLALWREAHGIYLAAAAAGLDRLAGQYGQSAALDRIEADAVTLELVDRHSGKIFRRDLPVRYSENDNGVILAGEAMDGRAAQIAFLSDTALAKMRDLFGKGADAPHCGGTEEH